MTPRYLLPLCLALLFVGCGEKLPKPTQTGSNTFGCKIDGEKWTPDGGGLFSGIKPISGGFLILEKNPKRLGIYITASSSDGKRVQIFLDSIEPKVYLLNQNTSPSANFTSKSYGYTRDNSGQTYMTSPDNTGQVIINKADTLTNIISGQFYFTAEAFSYSGQPSSTGTVKITEGRFDIKSPL